MTADRFRKMRRFIGFTLALSVALCQSDPARAHGSASVVSLGTQVANASFTGVQGFRDVTVVPKVVAATRVSQATKMKKAKSR